MKQWQRPLQKDAPPLHISISSRKEMEMFLFKLDPRVAGIDYPSNGCSSTDLAPYLKLSTVLNFI